MHILITGGAGYIGSVTTKLFLDAGHEVVVVDSLERGHRQAVDPRATLVIASVADTDMLDAVLPGTDVIVHFAGYIDVAESVRQPELYHTKNVVEPSVLLERAALAGVRSCVFSSTAAVYGEPDEVPIREDARLAPINPYGASKLEFERLLRAAEEQGALSAVRLRYFNVAGAWPDGSIGEAHTNETHIIPRLLLAASMDDARFTLYGDDYPTADGTCVRDYVHVVDLAEAHMAAAEYLAHGGSGTVCNLGSGMGYSNLEVVHACEEVTGSTITITHEQRRPGDPAVLVAAIERARMVLGWAPERDLTAMIADAWRWHQGHASGYEA